MEAVIEKIEQNAGIEALSIRVTLVVYKSNIRSSKPQPENYIFPWMYTDGREKDLAAANDAYKSAVNGWELDEIMRKYQNNSMDALRIGNCSLLQDPFHPEE